MSRILILIFLLPCLVFSQSDGGNGKVAKIKATELGKSNLAKGLKITNYGGEESKFRKGVLTSTFQWFNYKDTLGQTFRKRREYVDGYFMYDEELIAVPQTAAEVIRPTSRRIGKQIVLENALQGSVYYVYDGSE